MCGIDVDYDLLIPAEQGLGFDALSNAAEPQGYRGLNITLPYKVRARRSSRSPMPACAPSAR